MNSTVRRQVGLPAPAVSLHCVGTALEPSSPVSIPLTCAAPDALLSISSALTAPARLSPDPPPPVPLLHRRPFTCAASIDERAADYRLLARLHPTAAET
jgi:hypothetical protein